MQERADTVARKAEDGISPESHESVRQGSPSVALRIRLLGMLLLAGLLFGILGGVYVFHSEQMRLGTEASFRIELVGSALDSEFDLIRDLARQIPSRSRIRAELARYLDGEVDLDRLRSFTAPRLADALRSARRIQGILRLGPEGEPLVHVGDMPDRRLWPSAWHEADARFGSPRLHGEAFEIVVSAPILDDAGRRLGTDLVLFRDHRIPELLAIRQQGDALPMRLFLVAGQPSAPVVIGAEPPVWLVSVLRERPVADRTDGSLERIRANGMARLIAARPLAADGWRLLAVMNGRDFMAQPLKFGMAAGLAIFLATLMGSLLIMRAIRPLSEGLEHEALRRRREAREKQILLDQVRESEARLHEAQELAGMGNWELDLVTGRLWWSPQVYRIFELDPERTEVSYEAFLSRVHPDDREAVDRAYRTSVETRRPYEIVHRLLFDDGRVKHVHERGQTFYDDEGRPLRSIGTVQDITRQREIENELTRRERHFNLLLDSTAQAIYGLDREGRCTFANPACARLLGFDSPEEMVGLDLHEVIHHSHADGSHYPREACPIYRAFRTGEQVHVTGEVFWRRDGSTFPVEYWSYPMIEHGEVTGAVVTFFDLTERLESAKRLRLAASVFENTAEGILVSDPQGRILEVNRAFTEILGYGRDEVVGEQPRLWVDKEGRADLACTIRERLEREGGWRGEVHALCRDGSRLPVWLSVGAVRDDKGVLTHCVYVFTDLSPIRRSQEQLDYLAHHDALTGLPNRTSLDEFLEHELHHASRSGEQLAVLFLDLDRFKHINDSLGHAVGDELLRGVAARLRERLRDEDLVARIGGDEFVLVLREVGRETDAGHVAQKLMECLQEPIRIEGHEVHVTASIGIALYPRDGETAEHLLRNADAAMYRAKEEGRNTYRFYTEELTRRAMDRVLIESRLRHAIARHELFLEYQPQVSLTDGRLLGVEALVRWNDPERGLVPPGDFISQAEESALIHELGRWVLEESCRQAARWREEGFAFERLAVNVSVLELRRERFVDEVKTLLGRFGLPTGILELEVTESALMHEIELAAGMMEALRDLGVHLAIDDFGTGYSSLYYLKRLPVNRLKIDRSFVRDMPEDPNDVAIARAIVALGHSLGLGVIAEGVETEAQARLLLEAGCYEAQGYLYGRPMSPEVLEAWSGSRQAASEGG